MACKIEIRFYFAKLTISPSQEDFMRLEKVAARCKGTRQVLISRAHRAVVTKDKWSVVLATYLRECEAA
jgi:hypothetical protein